MWRFVFSGLGVHMCSVHGHACSLLKSMKGSQLHGSAQISTYILECTYTRVQCTDQDRDRLFWFMHHTCTDVHSGMHMEVRTTVINLNRLPAWNTCAFWQLKTALCTAIQICTLVWMRPKGCQILVLLSIPSIWLGKVKLEIKYNSFYSSWSG